MSLVGTRPPTVDEWEQYELHHRSRMSIKPGMVHIFSIQIIRKYGNILLSFRSSTDLRTVLSRIIRVNYIGVA